jgi:hypothetical protein|tara:strand:+ start:196 stop:378 length:183 start_codon:yes stop_codon:yes gene_type:complete
MDRKLILVEPISNDEREMLREINQDDITPQKKSKGTDLFEVTDPEDIEAFGDPNVLNEFL